MSTQQTIMDFITDELLDDEEEILFDTSLFKDNILDSLNLLALIAFLEKEYTIKVNASEINYDNLDSIDKISIFIGKKAPETHLFIG